MAATAATFGCVAVPYPRKTVHRKGALMFVDFFPLIVSAKWLPWLFAFASEPELYQCTVAR
jgi:hypothetical protein